MVNIFSRLTLLFSVSKSRLLLQVVCRVFICETGLYSKSQSIFSFYTK